MQTAPLKFTPLQRTRGKSQLWEMCCLTVMLRIQNWYNVYRMDLCNLSHALQFVMSLVFSPYWIMNWSATFCRSRTSSACTCTKYAPWTKDSYISSWTRRLHLSLRIVWQKVWRLDQPTLVVIGPDRQLLRQFVFLCQVTSLALDNLTEVFQLDNLGSGDDRAGGDSRLPLGARKRDWFSFSDCIGPRLATKVHGQSKNHDE